MTYDRRCRQPGQRGAEVKLCMTHWELLRIAIDERGLKRFIAKDAASAVQRMKREIEGTAGPDDYDPLMAANNLIWGNALEICGLEIMQNNADGSERCPLCWMNEQHKATCKEENCTFTFDIWITRAADDAEAYVKEHLT